MSITEALKSPPTPTRLLDGFPPDTRFVIAGVTWDAYENLVDALGERENFRVAFDGKDIEMMTLGPFHERQRSLLELFITVVAGELKIERQPMGSTTWKRKNLERSIESDLCYYFDPAKLAAATAAASRTTSAITPIQTWRLRSISHRPRSTGSGIYVALKVPEFWRARKRSVSIEHLGPDGEYAPAPQSRFLPVRPEEVTRWVFSEDSTDLVTWEERLREWVRSELVPRANA